MSFAIPKIQYKNLDTIGTTANASGVITAIPVTTLVEVGMFVRGTGIPSGAVVLSKTATTVTLANSLLATANGVGVTLNFGWEVEFDFPPIEESGDIAGTKSTISESLSGVRQVSVNHIEINRKLKFSFLSPSLYSLVNTFLTTHALLGEKFRYYENKTLTPYLDFELDKLKVNPKKIAPRGVDTYVWEVMLDFRRVL